MRFDCSWFDVRQSKRLRPQWLSYNYMFFFPAVDIVSPLVFVEAGHAFLPMIRDILKGAYTPSDADREAVSKLPDPVDSEENLHAGFLPKFIKTLVLHESPKTDLPQLCVQMQQYVEYLKIIETTDLMVLPVIKTV